MKEGLRDVRCHRCQSFQQPEKQICVAKEPDVGETISLAVPRLAKQKIGFGCLVYEGKSGENVGDDTDLRDRSQYRYNEMKSLLHTMIIWMLLNACGTPVRTLSRTGISSEKLPSDINYYYPRTGTGNACRLGEGTE